MLAQYFNLSWWQLSHKGSLIIMQRLVLPGPKGGKARTEEMKYSFMQVTFHGTIIVSGVTFGI